MSLTIAKQDQVQSYIIACYLTTICSHHIHYKYSMTLFKIPYMRLLLQSNRTFFPTIKDP